VVADRAGKVVESVTIPRPYCQSTPPEDVEMHNLSTGSWTRDPSISRNRNTSNKKSYKTTIFIIRIRISSIKKDTPFFMWDMGKKINDRLPDVLSYSAREFP